jgi:2-polyprenyl-6-methoxyphenol hydroxylase-like FAD-dependent oxidoreductase
MQPRRVVVAGGGIGGLAAAALLARTRHDVTLVERSSSLRAVGAGISLQPNGLAVADALGLVARLARHGSWQRVLALHDGRGRPLAQVEVPPAAAPLDAALVVPRQVLHDALADAAAAAGAAITTGAEVTGVAQEDDGVRVVVGPGGEHLRADLLVAADGARSAVRAGLAVGTQDVPGPVYLRALVPIGCPQELAGEHWDGNGLAGLVPCGAGATYWFASSTPDIRDAVASGLVRSVRTSVSAAHPVLSGAVQALEHVRDLLVNQVHTVRTTSFVDGRVVLLGDAAHAMPPNLGQGANSALVDAAVLALELAGEGTWAQALARYDADRRPSVRRVQRDAERLARVAHWRHGRGLRDLAVRSTPAAVGRRAARAAFQVDVVRLRDAVAALVDAGSGGPVGRGPTGMAS